MNERTMLIISTIAIGFLLICCVLVFYLWFRAERKLARYGESILYKIKKNNKK